MGAGCDGDCRIGSNCAALVLIMHALITSHTLHVAFIVHYCNVIKCITVNNITQGFNMSFVSVQYVFINANVNTKGIVGL